MPKIRQPLPITTWKSNPNLFTEMPETELEKLSGAADQLEDIQGSYRAHTGLTQGLNRAIALLTPRLGLVSGR